MELSAELTYRGFINQTTLKDLNYLDLQKMTFYFGVDPSAPSMTIGNLASIMLVRKFVASGHKAVILVGGATGLIGDPDGKAQERDTKSRELIESNKEGILTQYKQLLEGNLEIVDNYDWFKDINYLDFLRDVGKHVPMRQMMGRDFVKTRLSDEGSGISYAEFSYVLIQAYDFLHLHQEKGVDLQLCGADQWGNSVAGVDLIRRVTGDETHVLSMPLIVDKTTGRKFGKSEEGAVWLDPNMTSPFQFYQFWLNVDDENAEYYLKVYTELEKDDIDQIINEFNLDRSHRYAQKRLAYEVTSLVHGADKADEVKQATEALFGGGDFIALAESVKELLAEELGVIDFQEDFPEMLVEAELATSKSQARNLLESGAVSVNGSKANIESYDMFVDGKNLLKRGKNNFVIVNK